MAGQRLIDPSDPASVARMLKRIDTLEKKVAKHSGQIKRAQKNIQDSQHQSSQGLTNLQFTKAASTVTYPAGFITDNSGKTYNVAAGSITVPVATAPFMAVFSPPHGTIAFIIDTATVQKALASGAILIMIMNFSFGAVVPATAGTYPLGSAFNLV